MVFRVNLNCCGLVFDVIIVFIFVVFFILVCSVLFFLVVILLSSLVFIRNCYEVKGFLKEVVDIFLVLRGVVI